MGVIVWFIFYEDISKINLKPMTLCWIKDNVKKKFIFSINNGKKRRAVPGRRGDFVLLDNFYDVEIYISHFPSNPQVKSSNFRQINI